MQLLGGQTSIILQLSHPLIAAGVKAHSSFQNDPIGRFNRTVETMRAIVCGTKIEADEALARLKYVHRYVKGDLPSQMGTFKKGTPFSAEDPQLKLWVHATLMDTGLKIHELLVGKLTLQEKKQFYQESKLLAQLFNIPKELLPETLVDFNDYIAAMIQSETIVATSESKELVSFVTNPNLPPSFKLFLPLVNFLTSFFLPRNLASAYHLESREIDRLRLEKLAKGVRLLLPLLPELIRFAPEYRLALKRTESLSKKAQTWYNT